MPHQNKMTSEELDRLHADFLDSLDEELEMELDDLRGPDAMQAQAPGTRLSYFRNLIRLQLLS